MKERSYHTLKPYQFFAVSYFSQIIFGMWQTVRPTLDKFIWRFSNSYVDTLVILDYYIVESIQYAS